MFTEIELGLGLGLLMLDQHLNWLKDILDGTEGLVYSAHVFV